MVHIYHCLYTRVKVRSLLKTWVSVLKLTLLGQLNFLACALLLHITAQENKNAEKGRFPIMLYGHESQSQKSNHVDKLFTNTIRLSSLHECPRLPTILAEIFQSSTFFLSYSTISSFTSTESYFLLICLFGAELMIQRLSAA